MNKVYKNYNHTHLTTVKAANNSIIFFYRYGTPQPQPSYGSPAVTQTTTTNTQQQAVVNNQPLLFGDGTNLLGNGGSQAAYGGIYSR